MLPAAPASNHEQSIPERLSEPTRGGTCVAACSDIGSRLLGGSSNDRGGALIFWCCACGAGLSNGGGLRLIRAESNRTPVARVDGPNWRAPGDATGGSLECALLSLRHMATNPRRACQNAAAPEELGEFVFSFPAGRNFNVNEELLPSGQEALPLEPANRS